MLNPVIEAALGLQAFCQQNTWRFCFIDGIAVQRWGEPRFTNDCDLTLKCDFGDEDRYLSALLARFRSRSQRAGEFAMTARVLLLLADNDVPMDVALGSTGFEQQTIKRASPWRVEDNRSLITCSAEDLIVHKAFADCPKDWGDIETVLIKQHGKLKFKQIWQELLPLVELKESPDIEDRLRKLIAKVDRLAE
jgi:hypothetical protein